MNSHTKTAWLTGTTSGIGVELALDLARRGWQLVLPVRGPDRLQPLLADLHRLGAPEPTVLDCDLSDHVQVMRATDHAAELGPLDLVLNNAAAGGGADLSVREENDAGVELRMAVNVLTPHLVAQRLAPALTPKGRIVQVGSVGQAPLPLDDLNFEHDYEGLEAYCRSKLALIMSAMELAERGVPVNVVHPAHEMPTRMVREMGFPVNSTLDDGALAVLRMALDTDLDGVTGAYFHRFDRRDPHAQALDAAARRAVVAWVEEQLARSLR